MSDFWQETRVLVTGGPGFIGSHLVDNLVTFGAKVREADDFSGGLLSNLSNCKSELEPRNLDLTDLNACIDACRDVDVLQALAARVSRSERFMGDPEPTDWGCLKLRRFFNELAWHRVAHPHQLEDEDVFRLLKAHEFEVERCVLKSLLLESHF